jgi:hypothetical protein
MTSSVDITTMQKQAQKARDAACLLRSSTAFQTFPRYKDTTDDPSMVAAVAAFDLAASAMASASHVSIYAKQQLLANSEYLVYETHRCADRNQANVRAEAIDWTAAEKAMTLAIQAIDEYDRHKNVAAAVFDEVLPKNDEGVAHGLDSATIAVAAAKHAVEERAAVLQCANEEARTAFGQWSGFADSGCAALKEALKHVHLGETQLAEAKTTLENEEENAKALAALHDAKTAKEAKAKKMDEIEQRKNQLLDIATHNAKVVADREALAVAEEAVTRLRDEHLAALLRTQATLTFWLRDPSDMDSQRTARMVSNTASVAKADLAEAERVVAEKKAALGM